MPHARSRELYQPPLLPLKSPREILEHLDRHVIGQDDAKRAVSVAAYNHLKRIGSPRNRRSRLLKKANILMVGPSGTGKTHIARVLAEALAVPLCIVDATEYTEAGYYGKDVEAMVAELLSRSGHDVEAAERGIIFIDEVDKIARRDHGARTGSGPRDIGGLGVQQALLKMLEGAKVLVPQAPCKDARQDVVRVDTADILFICAGAFSDMARKRRGKGIGFDRRGGRASSYRPIDGDDLIEYGFAVEFLGRLPTVVELHELGLDDLVQILTVPPDALVKEYRTLLAMDDIDLQFERDAVTELARAALRRRTGARGLRSMMEELMREAMFEAPERKGQRIVIRADDVTRRLSKSEEAS